MKSFNFGFCFLRRRRRVIFFRTVHHFNDVLMCELEFYGSMGPIRQVDGDEEMMTMRVCMR